MKRSCVVSVVAVVLFAFVATVAVLSLMNAGMIAQGQVTPSISIRVYFPDFWEVLAPVHCDILSDGNVALRSTVDYAGPNEVDSWSADDLRCIASADGRYIGIVRKGNLATTFKYSDLGGAVLVVCDMEKELMISVNDDGGADGKAVFSQWAKTATNEIHLSKW